VLKIFYPSGINSELKYINPNICPLTEAWQEQKGGWQTANKGGGLAAPERASYIYKTPTSVLSREGNEGEGMEGGGVQKGAWC